MRRLSVVVVACAALVAAAFACRQQDPLYCGQHGTTDPRCPNFIPDAAPDGPTVLGYVSIGGNVLGLQGSGTPLGLDNNTMEQLSILPTGSAGPISFVFPTLLLQGSPYDVTVYQQPTGPSQTCLITNGSGTAVDDVTSIAVTCTTDTFTVGGTIVGLNNGNTIMLSLNGGTAQSYTGNGANMAFTLGSLPSGATYVVTPTTQNSGMQTCRTTASGTVGNANVTTVVVNCSTNFTIGGTLTGVNGTVALHNANTGDTIMVSSNGTFTFPTTEASGTPYAVTVSQNPTYPPAQQMCNVSMGSGTANADVTNIAVSCTTNTYTVGGMVSGLSGTLVLQDNGGDNKTITSNGSFTFATAIASGNAYSVTVQSNPTGQVCTVSMGNGTVKNANITSVSVSCSTAADSGILCSASTYCPASQDACCLNTSTGTGTCQSATMFCRNATAFVGCDDAADCGGGSHVCCATYGQNNGFFGAFCFSSASQCTTSAFVQTAELWCDPAAPSPCPSGMTCTGTPALSPNPLGYHKCM